jgi:protein arginine kinase
MMTEVEAMKKISDIRLGIALGIFTDLDEEKMARISAYIGSANVQKDSGEMLSPRQQEINRAEKIRGLLEKDVDSNGRTARKKL